MVNKFEIIGVFACIAIMAVAVFLLRLQSTGELFASLDSHPQTASVVNGADDSAALQKTLAQSMGITGDLKKLVMDDIVLGEGEEVKAGDTVTVNYIGTLEDGSQFDNSYVKGKPFTFTVGNGEVIKGWDEGLIGMKKGGQRILVIPSELAYGNRAVGPIPANANLVFAIELVDIK
jgi:FKBP-type peptidyl-prolyl cis-trans isomerase